MAKTHRYSDADVTFYMQSNFSVREWVKYMSQGYVDKAMREISRYMKKSIKDRIERGITPQGKRFAKLHPATVRYKRGRSRALIKSRRLMKSIKVQLTKNKLRIYTRSIYGRMMQKGVKYKTTVKQSVWMWYNLFDQDPGQSPFRPRQVTVPPRPFMGFSKKDHNMVRRIFMKHLKASERMGK